VMIFFICLENIEFMIDCVFLGSCAAHWDFGVCLLELLGWKRLCVKADCKVIYACWQAYFKILMYVWKIYHCELCVHRNNLKIFKFCQLHVFLFAWSVN
jgi:hypothetical protein